MHQIVKNDDNGVRLDRWLKENLEDISYPEIQKLIRKGQIRVQGGRKKSNYRVNAGEKIWFPPGYAISNMINKKIQPQSVISLDKITIYEDDSLLIIDKPYGLSTQGGTNVRHHLDRLLAEENEHSENKYRLVHRLDKYTSGAMIIAKKRDVASYYTRAFLNKQIKKCYLALTNGEFDKEKGVIELPLRKPQAKTEILKQSILQEAITRYEVIASTKDKISLLKLEPVTGRKHQIRKHLSMLNTPIIGDTKYSTHNVPEKVEKRFYLHSYIINFPSYTGEGDITVKASLPRYFENALNTLGVIFDE